MQAFDYVLVGGGLHNGLCALALAQTQPAARIALIEAGSSLGSNHTWSFFPASMPATSLAWLDPIVTYRWARHQVRFPGFTRSFELPYCSISSERFDAVVRAALARPGSQVMLHCRVAQVHGHAAVDSEGNRVEGEVVIDARGPQPHAARDCAFQKFVGLELETSTPHGIDAPVLMDARVRQHEGFRFLYVLPFSPTRCLVEDTRFCLDPELHDSMRREIAAYLGSQGISIKAVVRQELGVLPMPWSWTGEDRVPRASPLASGYAAGWFHPATGYSLPCAVRLADYLGSVRVHDIFGKKLESLWRELRAQARFSHWLNWLLFHTVRADLRWDVFERFHKLPPETITRFHAMQTTARDRIRILATRPPKGLSARLLWNSTLAAELRSRRSSP